MEKKPVVDGAWLEVEAKDILKRKAEVEAATLVALTNIRVELGKEEAARLLARLQECAAAHEAALNGMDEEQKAFFLFRQILMGL